MCGSCLFTICVCLYVVHVQTHLYWELLFIYTYLHLNGFHVLTRARFLTAVDVQMNAERDRCRSGERVPQTPQHQVVFSLPISRQNI